MTPIAFSPPQLGPEEEAAVLAVLRSGWLSRGPCCEQFEAELARRVKAAYAVSLSSCTAALHLALVALEIGPGDEVITSALTFVATVNAIRYTGATPVLVDVGPDYNMQPETIAAALTKRTRAVIGVDMHGLPCARPALPEGVAFIRDAAHSLGAELDGRPIGSDADATCFSFYATKQITCGDGGMLTTNDYPLAQAVRRLSLHGMDSQAWRRYAPGDPLTWQIPVTGYKANLTDIQAAIGREQLKKLDGFLDRRRQLAWRYDQLLGSYWPRVALPWTKQCWHLYAVQVPERDRVQEALRAQQIATGIHFRALPRYQAYVDLCGGSFPESRFPNACAIGDRTLSLPFHVGLTDAEQQRVVTALLKEAV